jgi:hypothetical protein
MRKAAQPDQRAPRWQPRAVQMLTAAAARPADIGMAASHACLTVAATRPHRVRSRAAAASSSTAVTRRLGSLFWIGTAAPSAAAAGAFAGRQPCSAADRFMSV